MMNFTHPPVFHLVREAEVSVIMSQPTPQSLTRRSALRALSAPVVAGAALGLVGCGSDDDADQTPEPSATLEPTQAEPTATQPASASPVAGYLDPNRWQGRTLTIATAGVSDYLDSLKAAFFDAFARDTGATVRHEHYGRDGANNVQAQVDANDVLWDVLLVPMSEVLDYSNRNLVEAIDYNIVDRTRLYPELTLQHGVGATLYSTTMVYSVSATKAPKSWADMVDLSGFEGMRALRRGPVGTLEFALLGDGVNMDELFPLDVDRAFAVLERMRESTIFYEDTKQPVELVRTGQASLASAWTVRTTLPDAASLVNVEFNQGMISADAWITPRNGQNQDVAMSFINYATRAVPTANFTGMQPYGPVNQDALALIREDIIPTLPNAPQNLERQFFENWSFWRENREPLSAAFEDWLLHPPATPGPATETD